MNYACINECSYQFIWSSRGLANVISRWDGFAVSVSSKLLHSFRARGVGGDHLSRIVSSLRSVLRTLVRSSILSIAGGWYPPFPFVLCYGI